MKFRVACLMGTYGRNSLATEALACFLQQTAIDDAMLLVYNQHPVPLTFDHPRVRIVNETPPPQRLRYIRRRMVELAGDDVEFYKYWDDDDLYLPWHLEDCLNGIGSSPAWKPRSSWRSDRNTVFSLDRNRFEASWLMRADAVRAVDVDDLPHLNNDPFFEAAENNRWVIEGDLGDFTSYIWRWDTGTEHMSGYTPGTPEKQAQNVEGWRNRSTDVRADGAFIPADLWPRWQAFLAGIQDQVTSENLAEIGVRLSLADGIGRIASGTPG